MVARVKRIAKRNSLVVQVPDGAASRRVQASHVSEDEDGDDELPVGTKGAKKRGGRPKGAPNRITTALKEAILLACSQHGYNGKGQDGLTGYLRRLARDEKRVMGSLLGRVVPLHITGSVEHTERKLRTKDEVVQELKDRGLSIDMIYNQDLDLYEPDKGDKGH